MSAPAGIDGLTSSQFYSESFLDAPMVSDPTEVKTPYAFLGIPFGPPYETADLVVCAEAANHVRALSHRLEYAKLALHYDFDLGEPLFADGKPTVTDLGDVIGDVRDPDAIWDAALEVIQKLVAEGRVPLVVGGLDSIPPIVVGGFVGVERINVLHVDAHLDFRQDVGGVTRGYSSPIRRIRELECVEEVVQVGLRAVGSARPADVADAIAAGNRLVTAAELHQSGADALLASLPTDRRWVVTIDCDGLDPTIAPGVGWPEPGGVDFNQIRTVLAGLAAQNLVAAVVFTEFRPDLDIHDITAQTITRLLINVIGHQRVPVRLDSEG
jgi:agmatinase